MELHSKEFSALMDFWNYFKQITQIPRCSGNEGKIRNFIKKEAENFNFETLIDKAGNLLIKIPSLQDKKSVVIIQSHLDMVCEKNENIKHDFAKDPLKLEIIKLDGKEWLTAVGTTLGADNGVGLAYSLVLMKKVFNREIKFENLEIDLLFTVGEESGLFGAYQIDKHLIRGNFLINLDSEKENTITIGCTGILLTDIEVKLNTINIREIQEDLIPIQITVYGLLGGHSGVEINKGRANANKIIAKILWNLNKKFSIYVNSINGGGKNRNVIARESNAIVYIRKVDSKEIKIYLDNLFSDIKDDYTKVDYYINFSIHDLVINSEDIVFSKNIQNKILSILFLMPHGPISMHPEINNLVFTSTNLSSIQTSKNRIKLGSSQRSFKESSSKEISDKMIELFQLAGIEIRSNQKGGIGTWIPNFNSRLMNISKQVYKELFNKDPFITAIHAGLEPGIFKPNFPYLDMISIGPNTEFCHSPDERLDIESVNTFWKYLINLIKKLNEIL